MRTFDVIDKISTLPLLKYQGVVDLVDKMSFIGSCVFLIACSLIVTLREYVMDPISCYMSHNPGGENILKFMENYCWVQGTMTFAGDIIPTTDTEWKEFEKSRIVYYQWVPFMLLFQAALFHLPKIIWTLVCFNMTGMNLELFMKTSSKKKPEDLAAQIGNFLVQHREYRTGHISNIKSKLYKIMNFFVISKRFATWLSFGYIFIKILYLVNGISQIYLMQVFLQLHSNEEYSSNFGLEITKNIIRGRNWESTNVFPRVTYCLARVKQLGAVNTVTAQCVLTANLFIEKIYIFLWFWITLVVLCTAFSLITWIFRLFIPSGYLKEIKKHLKLQKHSVKDENVKKFVKEFLRRDGIFLLYMITINSGDLVTGCVVSELYKNYLKYYKEKNLWADDDDIPLYKLYDSEQEMLDKVIKAIVKEHYKTVCDKVKDGFQGKITDTFPLYKTHDSDKELPNNSDYRSS